MEKTEIEPGRYRHFKGGEYEVIGTALHSETLEPMVVYRALYGEHGLWVRPAAMWNETIERDGKRLRRFEKIDAGICSEQTKKPIEAEGKEQ
ncbi:MAG: DUF1653 domain-containing protein [Oscillospiraceae bacterium]|nr:DUF1653 domain-containing protein [Oscillospiraceae bacterium]MDY4190876.1 DUF1653 domain-containing protein [Oscillospiraceae bacterium]